MSCPSSFITYLQKFHEGKLLFHPFCFGSDNHCLLYTSQYKDLQSLYETNKDKLEIIAVPCNDYGSQESGSNSEIKNFCETNYGVSFTMGSKQKIKSSPMSDLYRWLSDPKQNGWNSSLPSWNFCKYVINEDGQLTHFLRSGVSPTGKEMSEIIVG